MKKVLIVDDDRNIAEALSVRLRSRGYEPMVEYNGVCGVCHAMDYRPDFIVIDINMPSGDGYFMAKAITDQLTCRYCIPFVFMTASSVPETRKNGLGMGALDVLEKPFEPDDLIRIIDQFT